MPLMPHLQNENATLLKSLEGYASRNPHHHPHDHNHHHYPQHPHQHTATTVIGIIIQPHWIMVSVAGVGKTAQNRIDRHLNSSPCPNLFFLR